MTTYTNYTLTSESEDNPLGVNIPENLTVTLRVHRLEDLDRVNITTLKADDKTDNTLRLEVPPLEAGVEHTIGTLNATGEGNTLLLSTEKSLTLDELHLNYGSSVQASYGTGSILTLTSGSQLALVDLKNQTYPVHLMRSTLRQLTLSDAGYQTHYYNDCRIYGFGSGSNTVLTLENADTAYGRYVNLPDVLEAHLPEVETMTIHHWDTHIFIENLVEEPIHIQQLHHGDETFVQMGCWFGTLKQAQELINGDEKNWPSYDDMEWRYLHQKAESYVTGALRLKRAIGLARARYRAALQLIEANHPL